MSSTRWGSLLLSSVAALAPACAPVPPTVEPRPATAPSAAPPEAPPEAAPGLSDFHRALPDLASTPSRGEAWTKFMFLGYGRGTFEHRFYDTPDSATVRCPIQTERGCATFLITTTGVSPVSGWPVNAPDLPEDKLVPHGPFPAPQEWIDFEEGRDAMYALRRGGEAIDRIDDQGKVSLLIKNAGLAGWEKFTILEQGSRLFVIGRAPRGDEPWKMAEVTGGKLGPFAKLPMAPLFGSMHDAQGARDAMKSNGMAMIQGPLVAPPDEATPDVWTAVWLEAVPPPYGWPTGKPYRNPLPPRKAKNGCGRPSRTLNDRSVEKRAHVTRFRGAELVDDTVAWATNDLDLYGFQLTFHVEKGKTKVDPPPRGQAPPSEASLPFEVVPPSPTMYEPNESVVGLGFDPASGEGMLVVRAGSDTDHWLRTFDARGVFTGEPVAHHAPLRGMLSSLHRIKGRWYGVQAGKGLVNLTEDLPLTSLPSPDAKPIGTYVEGDQLHLLWYHEPRIWLTRVDLQGTMVGQRETIATVPEGFRASSPVLDAAPGVRPRLVIVQTREQSGGQVGGMEIRPDGTWTFSELPSAQETPLNGIFFHPLPGEMVLSYQDGNSVRLWWTRAGTPFLSQRKSERLSSRTRAGRIQGPIFGSPPGLLPVQPGEVREVEGGEVIERECGRQVMTDATTVVLACARAADPVKPGVLAGLRTFHTSR